MDKDKVLSIPVLRGYVLGVSVYRGYANLNELALISKADIYDQKNNPTGTQRDLSPKHAKDAYIYIKNRELAFWPEVFLCVRNKKVIEFKPSKDNENYGILTIDRTLIINSNKIFISRIDGNHRLHYADGIQKGFTPIEKPVSFCMAYNLSQEEEIILFRDINNNQRRMNTSHLDNIETRLSTNDNLRIKVPPLYIAQKLGSDHESPLFDKIYEGGKRITGQFIPLRSIKTGIQYMLSRPTKLSSLKDPDAQYRVIKNYFSAIKQWEPDAWNDPKNYIILRGAGLWAICFIGADVIDRALTKGKFESNDMLKVLQSGKKWDWSNKGEFDGLGGRNGAIKISEMITNEFTDESGPSLKEIYKRIMSDK